MQVISPAPRDAWRSVVADDFHALPDHAPEWVAALCRVGSYTDASRMYFLDDGRRDCGRNNGRFNLPLREGEENVCLCLVGAERTLAPRPHVLLKCQCLIPPGD